MAEHLGLMADVEGAEATTLTLVQDFARFAQDQDAAYLLVAAADTLSEGGHAARAKELFAVNERHLTKEGRRWMRKTLDAPEGFVPRLLDEGLADLDIEDVCLHRALVDGEEDEDEDLDDSGPWDDEDDEDAEEELPRPGRNDPCWCGSGKKYKKCHLETDEEAARGEPDDPVRNEAMGGLLTTAERIHKRRDTVEATRQYFGEDIAGEAAMEAGSEGFFLWYLFNFRPQSTGRSAVEEHLRKNTSTLTGEVRELLEAWRDSRYGLFAVRGTPEGKGVELADLFAGDILLVRDTAASPELHPGEYVLARVEKCGGRVAFSGDPLTVSPEVLPALKELIQAEIENTAQTPAQFVQDNIHRLHRVLKQL